MAFGHFEFFLLDGNILDAFLYQPFSFAKNQVLKVI